MPRQSLMRVAACSLLLAVAACGVKGGLQPPAGTQDTGPRDIILTPPAPDRDAPEASEQGSGGTDQTL